LGCCTPSENDREPENDTSARTCERCPLAGGIQFCLHLRTRKGGQFLLGGFRQRTPLNTRRVVVAAEPYSRIAEKRYSRKPTCRFPGSSQKPTSCEHRLLFLCPVLCRRPCGGLPTAHSKVSRRTERYGSARSPPGSDRCRRRRTSSHHPPRAPAHPSPASSAHPTAARAPRRPPRPSPGP
jgi:hypothetical protein